VNLTELRDGALLLAPGFIALKVFYLFGVQRQRSQWEWVVWSVLASLPLDWVVRQVVPALNGRLHWQVDLLDGAARFFVALAAGILGSLAWRLVARSRWRWFRERKRDVTDSAFDLVIEEAVREKRPIELVTREGEDTVSYRGWIHTVARESSQAEPWMYISQVQVKAAGGKFTKVPGTHGMLLHRDRIERVRVYQSASEIDLEASRSVLTAVEARSEAAPQE
jgi:hypothetical protein